MVYIDNPHYLKQQHLFGKNRQTFHPHYRIIFAMHREYTSDTQRDTERKLTTQNEKNRWKKRKVNLNEHKRRISNCTLFIVRTSVELYTICFVNNVSWCKNTYNSLWNNWDVSNIIKCSYWNWKNILFNTNLGSTFSSLEFFVFFKL